MSMSPTIRRAIRRSNRATRVSVPVALQPVVYREGEATRNAHVATATRAVTRWAAKGMSDTDTSNYPGNPTITPGTPTPHVGRFGYVL